MDVDFGVHDIQEVLLAEAPDHDDARRVVAVRIVSAEAYCAKGSKPRASVTRSLAACEMARSPSR